MTPDPSSTHYYRRARFTTRLPTHYLYAPSHYWLSEVGPGVLRVGLTKFATRMLGDFVEREIQVPLGESVQVGQAIGWIEGFKAVADIYSVADGRLAGINIDLDEDPRLVEKDPYGHGWLYLVEGKPDKQCVDCKGYVSLLDHAIDRMLARQKLKDNKC